MRAPCLGRGADGKIVEVRLSSKSLGYIMSQLCVRSIGDERLRGELPPGFVGCVLQPELNQRKRRAMKLKLPWVHSAIEVGNPDFGLNGRKEKYGTRR